MPKRWGVSRQAKGRKLDPTRDDFPPYLRDGACYQGYRGRQKEIEIISMKYIASDESELFPVTDVEKYLTSWTVLYLLTHESALAPEEVYNITITLDSSGSVL
jgi:hypothetical protein